MVFLLISEHRVHDLSRVCLRNEFMGVGMDRRLSPCTEADPCWIQMVADMDTRSFITGEKPSYQSKMIYGQFFFNADGVPNFSWANDRHPIDIIGHLAEEGRGMELSELVLWKDQLLAFDDRTGIVYDLLISDKNSSDPQAMTSYLSHASKIDENLQVLPVARYILSEQPDSAKGMKIEWACEKDGSLYVGSFGKEYTTRDGSRITGEANFWIVRLTETSHGTEIDRINWKSPYERLREITGTSYPGYLIHEAVNWSPIKQRWYFLPRRVSTLHYDDKEDEKRGSNIMIAIDAEFRKYKIVEAKFKGDPKPARGFSSFKFIPGSNDDLILAIRSEEDDAAGILKSHISVINVVTGEVIYPETEVSSEYKFEGVEIW